MILLRNMDPVPSPDVQRPKRFEFPPGDKERLTHYLFRYPAKFHPPVVRHLIQTYTASDATVLDPFCGSGTLLVEAGVCGRSAIGIDVDPLAVFVSNVKAHRYRISALRESCANVLATLDHVARPESEYERRQFVDIKPETVARAIRDEQLSVPAIPNIYHWFRHYVVVVSWWISRAFFAVFKRLISPRRTTTSFSFALPRYCALPPMPIRCPCPALK